MTEAMQKAPPGRTGRGIHALKPQGLREEKIGMRKAIRCGHGGYLHLIVGNRVIGVIVKGSGRGRLIGNHKDKPLGFAAAKVKLSGIGSQ